MKLGKSAKTFIGIATVATWLLPFAAIAFWFVAVFGFIAVMSAVCGGPGPCDPPPFIIVIFPLLWFGFIFLLIVTGVVSIALRIFYHVHITLNKTASDMFRVFITIGLFFLPFIAEPLYFYACIWRAAPPEWALPASQAIQPSL